MKIFLRKFRRAKFTAIVVAFIAALASNSIARATTYTWINSAGGNWNVASNWSSSTVPQSPGQAADIPATLAVAVTMNVSPNIDSLSIDSSGSTLGISAGDALTVTDGIANNGTITLAAPFGPETAALTFSGSQTLSGTGSVILDVSQLNTSNSGVLTQALGQTISGQGTINAALINQGLINANVSGGTLSLATNPMTSAGTMEATGGGLLSMKTTVNNAGGMILAASGGIVQVGSGSTINNGTLLASGGTVDVNSGSTIVGATLTSTGTSYFQAGGGTLSGDTLSNGSQFNVPAGQTLTVTGGIANNGTITLAGPSGPRLPP